MEARTYVVTIKPDSAFGTPLKGDTLFGQFCWQIAEDPGLSNRPLSELLKDYENTPFLVFSSAWPVFVENGKWTYALPRPEVPLFMLEGAEGNSSCAERLRKRKENKGKRWLLMSEELTSKVDWSNLIDDRELFFRIQDTFSSSERERFSKNPELKAVIQAEQQHNTINRETMTTGKGMFAPYVMKNTWYMPGMELAVFFAINGDSIAIDKVLLGLERIGRYGFGRDASTGLGRFSLGECEEIKWPECQKGQAVFTLAPAVPERGRYKRVYFRPFTRFGRHGPQLAHTGRPFKNPVVMADEGAVLMPEANDNISQPWIGQAVTGVSKAMPETVTQGYAMALPIELG